MKTFDFLQTGGLPFEADILKGLLDSYGIFNDAFNIVGELTILYGCETQGTQITNGVVYFQGEVLEFRGGLPMATVKIFEQETFKVFENGQSKVVIIDRWVGFGSGGNTVDWTDFIRLKTIKQLTRAAIPVGMISMWSGAIANIPAGWELCDGSNGNPDLRGKFTVGIDSNDPQHSAIGQTGGLKNVALTQAQLASHSHNGSANNAGAHTHTHRDTLYTEEVSNGLTSGITNVDNVASGGVNRNCSTDVNGNGVFSHNRTVSTSSTGIHGHSLTIESTGAGEAHENLPPYYTLAYIIYKG